MKSIMSIEMYEKLKLKNLNSTNIPHLVGTSGKSLGARGKTKCEININGKIFYQTFIVCKHLKRPIILGRDFSIQNCIGISWTKTNTHQLTQNNKVIAETAEYQTPSIASVSLNKTVASELEEQTVASELQGQTFAAELREQTVVLELRERTVGDSNQES